VSSPEDTGKAKTTVAGLAQSGRHAGDGDLPSKNALIGAPVPLESILCTEELHRRSSRPPDYEKENRALGALARALADSPRTILQTLADTILEVCASDSAGISLLTTHDAASGSIGQPSLAGGSRISAAAHRAISALAGMCLIATFRC